MNSVIRNWVLLPILLLGIGLGYFARAIFRSANKENTIATTPVSVSPEVAIAEEASKSPSKFGAKERVAQILAMEGLESKTIDLLEGDDIQTAFLLLMDRRGIRSLRHEERIALEDLAWRWYRQDPTGITDWIKKQPNHLDRRVLFEDLIERIMREGFEEAVVFLERHVGASDTAIHLTEEFLDLAVAESPELLVRAVSATFTKNNQDVKSTMHSFPEGIPDTFDERSFLDQMVEGGEPLEGWNARVRNAQVGSILRHWAKRDPDEAAKWFQKNREGIKRNASRLVFEPFLAGLLEGKHQQHYDNLLPAFSKFAEVRESIHKSAVNLVGKTMVITISGD